MGSIASGRLRAAGVLAVALLVSACGAGAGSSPSSSAPPAAPSVGATPGTSQGASGQIAQPSTTGTSLPIIGGPADDGARITDVQEFDARTRDLTIDSPAVGIVTVRVTLPAAFDEQPDSRWPALYLLLAALGA